jgi:hypothetical protein
MPPSKKLKTTARLNVEVIKTKVIMVGGLPGFGQLRILGDGVLTAEVLQDAVRGRTPGAETTVDIWIESPKSTVAARDASDLRRAFLDANIKIRSVTSEHQEPFPVGGRFETSEDFGLFKFFVNDCAFVDPGIISTLTSIKCDIAAHVDISGELQALEVVCLPNADVSSDELLAFPSLKFVTVCRLFRSYPCPDFEAYPCRIECMRTAYLFPCPMNDKISYGRLEMGECRLDTVEEMAGFLEFTDACGEVVLDFRGAALVLPRLCTPPCTPEQYESAERVINRVMSAATDAVKDIRFEIDDAELLRYAISTVPVTVSELLLMRIMDVESTVRAITQLQRPIRVNVAEWFSASDKMLTAAAEAAVPGLWFNLLYDLGDESEVVHD